jgi:hypothetical protein
MISLLTALTLAAAPVEPFEVQFCTTIGDYAEQVMQSRQNSNLSYMDIYAVVVKNDVDPPLAKLMVAILDQAFNEQPMWSEDGKRRQRMQFRSTVEAQCMRSVK